MTDKELKIRRLAAKIVDGVDEVGDTYLRKAIDSWATDIIRLSKGYEQKYESAGDGFMKQYEEGF